MIDPTTRFNALYQNGATIHISDEAIPIHVETLIELLLPTGYVVACDPSYDDTTPFNHSAPPGRYRVSIAMIRHPLRGNRPLAARLDFADGDIAHWALALRPDQDASTLAPGEVFCYSVDAGVGCFMDVQTARQHAQRLNANMSDQDRSDAYWLSLANKFYETEQPYWMNHVVDASSGANLVMFSSGWGDGCYSTYEGWSADGRLLCLMTDFGLR